MGGRGLMRLISPALSLAVLAALHGYAWTRPTAADAEGYHARARAEVAAIPRRIGAWEGTDVAVPPSAVALLRPNALFSRRYRHERRGTVANLILVQCRDVRDMSGHYPPNCYPAHGWLAEGEARRRRVSVGGLEVPVTEYRFARREFNRSTRIVIWNFFVLPGEGLVDGMEAVRRASGEPRTRPYGAAQVQVMTSAELGAAERERAFRELVGPLTPLLGALRLGAEGDEP